MDNITYIPLKIGMIGQFHNTPYTIKGRVRWQSQYKEFYETENSKGYSSESWMYDEWILQDHQGEVCYLCEDKEGFALSYAIVAEVNPSLKPGKDYSTKFLKHHPSSRIREYGKSYISHLEGEVGEDSVVRLTKVFFQYQYQDQIFVQEVYDYGKPNQRREYYKEKKISRKEVLTAFLDNPEIQLQWQGLQTHLWAGRASVLIALLFFVMFVMSFFNKKTVFHHSIAIPDGVAISPDTVFKIPTWEIDKINQLYLLEMQYAFPYGLNGNLYEVFVDAYIYEEGLGIVSQLVGDYYYEQGRDSEGPWTEYQTEAHKYVRSDRKGRYSAELYLERMPDNIGGTLHFYVRERWFVWYYTLPALLLALMLWIGLEITYKSKSS